MTSSAIPSANDFEEELLQWIARILASAPECVAELRAAIVDHPGRISRAYTELLGGYLENPATFIRPAADLSAGAFSGYVTSREIPFVSMCAHHFLPFHGMIDVAYEPGEFILGLGKIPRLVQCRARRFQLQELLVRDIAGDFMTHVGAKGVYVRSRAAHICVCYRGPTSYPTYNVVDYSLGTLQASHSAITGFNLGEVGK